MNFTLLPTMDRAEEVEWPLSIPDWKRLGTCNSLLSRLLPATRLDRAPSSLVWPRVRDLQRFDSVPVYVLKVRFDNVRMLEPMHQSTQVRNPCVKPRLESWNPSSAKLRREKKSSCSHGRVIFSTLLAWPVSFGLNQSFRYELHVHANSFLFY